MLYTVLTVSSISTAMRYGLRKYNECYSHKEQVEGKTCAYYIDLHRTTYLKNLDCCHHHPSNAAYEEALCNLLKDTQERSCEYEAFTSFATVFTSFELIGIAAIGLGQVAMQDASHVPINDHAA